ncbi:putative rRNA pseudouridine synthase [Encephalitozoon romaleae SJ-2008]|uniref:H/ACA ribonucleoprotein complex subunit CBF5 n=1 Tax=Encephalitozoon romaleae (strain SJ-2008) TaxID=1178016 RepID=I6ZTP0_ENCRO|nr:putative rRNA pseudouridine synthase [Encephalitozoon romaleae SJ-2008]AFN83036.1 putative rRNA pseudouridine synthase [Encephalitozoon romaleae SJ-2008]
MTENLKYFMEDKGLSTSETWDLLLADMDKMVVRTNHYTPLGCGSMPLNRKIGEYIKYGIVNLDKSSNPSSHEVVTWVKEILKCEKTGHSGTLDPQVSGVLTICIDRATRLTKSQQSLGKEYVCVIEFLEEPNEAEFHKISKRLIGSLLQRPPLMCAVKRELRVRNIYNIDILEFSKEKRVGLFKVSCEAGTYVRTLCTHMGILMGCGAKMKELRRTRSGRTSEKDIFTLHDLLDAVHIFNSEKDETVIRRVIRPLESLLVGYPRIMIKDSCVNAICYGAKLSVTGVLRFDRNIDVGKEIVIITTKGEAVALGIALVSSPEMSIIDHGLVCRTKRVIMEKDLYPRSWGFKNEYEILSE